MQGLQWSGSHLGNYSFTNVIPWMTPAQKEYKAGDVVFKVVFTWHGKNHLAYLKRNNQLRADSCILDELKPLFGLRKMGTHRIRLDMYFTHPDRKGTWLRPDGSVKISWARRWAEYILIRSDVKTINEVQDFAPYYSFDSYPQLYDILRNQEEAGRVFRLTIQKIFIYRLLCRVDGNTTSNILVHADNQSITSIGECRIVNLSHPFNWLTEESQRIYFPRLQNKESVICKMFNLNRENYRDELSKLQQNIMDIVIPLDEQHTWLADHVYTNLHNMLSNYFHNPLD